MNFVKTNGKGEMVRFNYIFISRNNIGRYLYQDIY